MRLSPAILITMTLVPAAVAASTCNGNWGGDPIPQIQPPTFAGEAAQQVQARRRIARRDARRSTGQSEDQRIINTAMAQYLLLSETLLNRGDRIGGPRGSQMVILGTTLLEGLPAVESLLTSTPPLGVDHADETRRDLVRFAQGVRAGLSSIPSHAGADLDGPVTRMMQPLADACARMAGEPLPETWWRPASVVTGLPATTPIDLEQRWDSADFEPELRARLESMQGSDQRPLQEAATELVVQVERSKWMSGPAQRAIQTAVLAGLNQAVAGTDTITSVQGRLAAMQRLIDAWTAFATAPGGRAVAARKTSLLVELFEAWPGHLPPIDPTHAMAVALETLAQARTQEGQGLERLRKRLHVGLAQQRMAAERTVFDALPEVARSESPWTDPALVVVLSTPRQLLEAMQRLRRLDVWLAEAQHHGGESAAGFNARMEGLVASMLQERTREDAARALREFERQLEMFRTLEPRAVAIEIPTSTRRQLLRLIARARSTWISDWSQGRSAGVGAADLHRLQRVVDFAGVVNRLDRAALEHLDNWAAWELPIDLLEDWRDACEAQLADIFEELEDGTSVERPLRRLEHSASMLKLAHVLLDQSPEPTRGHPALIVLAEVTARPSADSMLEPHRQIVAQLGHALLELDSLNRQERFEAAERVEAWIMKTASRLLRRLGTQPAAPLAVPGMRSDDRNARGGGPEMMRQ